MKIVLKNAYIVDHENSSIEYKDIKSNEFYYYVKNLLQKIDASKKSSDFKIRNCGSTQVINQCKLITETCFRERDDSKEEIDFQKISPNTKIIAERFLEKESCAQEKVNRMNVKIKVGCLIFSVIQVGEKFQLLIAKLDSISGLELEKFTHADIIEDNEKKLGKSCLIDINCDEGHAEIGRIRILLDNRASYFSKDFLEVDPIYEDSFCTEKAVKSVLGIVDSSLKKEHPRDRQLIRNSFILYMRRNDFIDYDDMVKEIFTDYFDSESCEIEKGIKLRISNKLEELPEKQKFSRQFNRISENITAKLTKVEYKLAEDLELIINGAKIQDNLQQNNDLFDRVIAGEENDGRSFLKIYTNNEDALNTFKKRE